MSALTTYIVAFDPEHTVTVLAADKAAATRVANAHFATVTGTPGWTRIPRFITVAV